MSPLSLVDQFEWNTDERGGESRAAETVLYVLVEVISCVQLSSGPQLWKLACQLNPASVWPDQERVCVQQELCVFTAKQRGRGVGGGGEGGILVCSDTKQMDGCFL